MRGCGPVSGQNGVLGSLPPSRHPLSPEPCLPTAIQLVKHQPGGSAPIYPRSSRPFAYCSFTRNLTTTISGTQKISVPFYEQVKVS